MTGFLLSVLTGLLPMILFAWLLYYLDRYEKEPLKLLAGVFIWGGVIAAGAAFLINSFTSLGLLLLTKSELTSQLATSTLVAPVVEEILKGAAVLVVYLLYKPEFDSPLDGIVYAGIAALGFAATENIWYIHQFGYLQNGYRGLMEITLVRVLLVGWQHPFYTSFTGLGLALSRQARDSLWRWLFPFLGLGFAIAFHLLHNLLASLVSSAPGVIFNVIWDWSGYLGLLLLILLLIRREQNWMKTYLKLELDQGWISQEHFQVACSAWRQSLALGKGILEGNSRQIRRFYQACGDLMHKSRQVTLQNNVFEAEQEIIRLRAELGLLAERI